MPLTDHTKVAPGVELVTVGLMVELPQTDCGQAISQLGAGTTLTLCEQVCGSLQHRLEELRRIVAAG